MPRRQLKIVNQPKGVNPILTPRQRLVKIAPDRVAKAVKALRHLHQLANPAVYDLRQSDKEKIVDVLSQEIVQLEYVLDHPGKSAPVVRFDEEE